MQVCSPSVSFMAQETYAVENTTDFSIHFLWLPNFLLDRSLPLITLLTLVIFCAVLILMSMYCFCLASASVAERNICKRAVQQLSCLQAMVRDSHSLELSSDGVCIVNTIVCLIWVRKFHNCLWNLCLPGSRLCWNAASLFFHNSFENELKPFKIF